MKPTPLLCGFTLVEMLVVISVTIMLAGSIVTYTSKSRNQVAVRVEAVKIAQTIARAKSLAVSTYNSPEVPCGYGVHFEYDLPEGGDRYSLFRYEAPQCSPLTALDPAFRATIPGEIFALSSHVNAVKEEDSVSDILFVPPDPDTFIVRSDSAVPARAGRVYLETEDGSLRVTIGVSGAGQITF